jgi:PBP1b-binding outer membrane lipoprotein LpoB
MNALKVTIVAAVLFIAVVLAGCQGASVSDRMEGQQRPRITVRPTGTGWHVPDVAEATPAE